MPCCKEFEDAIWEAAETDAMPVALQRHVQQCAGCRRSLEAASRALKGLAELRSVDAPDPTAAVNARLAKTLGRPRWFPGLVTAAGLGSIVIAVVFLAVRHLEPAPGRNPARQAPRIAAGVAPAPRAVRPPLRALAPRPSLGTERSPAASARIAKRGSRAPIPKQRHARPMPAQDMGAPTQVPLTPRLPAPASPDIEPEEPCPRLTIIVTQPEEGATLKHSIFDPTYCALVLPKVRYVSQSESEARCWHCDL